MHMTHELEDSRHNTKFPLAVVEDVFGKKLTIVCGDECEPLLLEKKPLLGVVDDVAVGGYPELTGFMRLGVLHAVSALCEAEEP